MPFQTLRFSVQSNGENEAEVGSFERHSGPFPHLLRTKMKKGEARSKR